MKIYLAAAYATRDALRAQVLPALLASGHTSTSSWLHEHHTLEPGAVGTAATQSEDYAVFHAQNDLDDVARSDGMLLLTDAWCLEHLDFDAALLRPSGGRHVETGYALALNVDVVVVGPDENVFHRGLCLTASDVQSGIEALQRAQAPLGRG